MGPSPDLAGAAVRRGGCALPLVYYVLLFFLFFSLSLPIFFLNRSLAALDGGGVNAVNEARALNCGGATRRVRRTLSVVAIFSIHSRGIVTAIISFRKTGACVSVV